MESPLFCASQSQPQIWHTDPLAWLWNASIIHHFCWSAMRNNTHMTSQQRDLHLQGFDRNAWGLVAGEISAQNCSHCRLCTIAQNADLSHSSPNKEMDLLPPIFTFLWNASQQHRGCESCGSAAISCCPEQKREKKKEKSPAKATHLFAGLQGYGICHFQAVNCRREIQLGSGEFLDAVACPVGRHGCLLVISCMCSLQWSQPDSPLCSRDVIGKPPGKRPVPGVFKKSYYI